jgi:transcriptional regulator with XRE-family HTH domain
MYPRLKYLRENKGLNQTQVASMLGLTQTGYSKYETGENEPSIQTLIALSILYNTSVDYIVGLTDVKNRYEMNHEAAHRYAEYARNIQGKT